MKFSSEVLPVPGKETHELGLVALRYFNHASMRFPASVTAQAAGIAQRCQDEGYNPLTLMHSLLRNPYRIDQIVMLANLMHQRKQVESPASNVTPLRAIDIVVSDFRFASDMLDLEPSRLRYITENLYNQYRGIVTMVELIFRNQVLDVIEEQKPEADLLEYKGENWKRTVDVYHKRYLRLKVVAETDNVKTGY